MIVYIGLRGGGGGGAVAREVGDGCMDGRDEIARVKGEN